MAYDEIAQLIPTIKPESSPFHAVPIKDSGEDLVNLDEYGLFAFQTPHPYMAAGAPYGGKSPFMLRRGVASRLVDAQASLARRKPGWRIKIFDGYRPVAVQAHMVAHSFVELARAAGLDPLKVEGAQKEQLLRKVYRIWSPPNRDPVTPPPHSTGAALDCLLLDESGAEVDMGSPVDFNGDESDPDFFRNTNPVLHANRELLRACLEDQGFLRHRREWWHFSYGDQYWAWQQKNAGNNVNSAIYGRVE